MAITQRTTIISTAEDGTEICRADSTRKLYEFNELGEEAQESILQRRWDINVDYEWWEHIYEDAATIGLRIDGFDLGNKRSIEGELTENLLDCCLLIRKHHSKGCDTFQTARKHLREYGKALGKWRKVELADDPEYYSDYAPIDWINAFECEDEAQELMGQFKLELLQDYYSMLNGEYEYQTSEEQVKQSVSAMGDLYTEDGSAVVPFPLKSEIVEAAFPAPPACNPRYSMTLYQELVIAGCEIGNHESDLHVKECEKAMSIIFRHFFFPGSTMKMPSRFASNIDGSVWWDIPFAYDPFWNK